MMITTIGVIATAFSASLLTQQVQDRGAIAIRRGADTLVVDRFIRQADTLQGSVQVRGQPRIDYFVLLGSNETVRSLTIGVYAAGSAANAPPLQRVKVTLAGDTAVVETPAGVQRVPTKVGAVPSFNNALAISELFSRRARLTGGAATIPYFAMSGGATIDVVVQPLGTDSMIATIAQQVERLKVDPVGRILGGTIVGPNFEFIRLGPEAANGLVISLRDSSVAPKTDYSAPAGAPYTAEEVRVPRIGFSLGGTLTIPAGGRGPYPAVVTLTGSGQQDRDEFIPFAGGIRLFRAIADTLGRRGIAVLRLDDRGLGASGGPVAGTTSEDGANDMRAAIAYLRERKEIDPDRIGVIGHSEGGAIAPMLAAGDPRLKALVAMAAPGERGIEISMAQNKYIVDHDTSLTPAKRDSILRAARNSLNPEKQTDPWIKFWLSYDPAPVARQVKAPTLILQGESDRQVPAEQAEKLASLIKAGGNSDVTVRVFPAVNHLFVDDSSGDFRAYDKLTSNRISPAVLGVLADWLATKLGAGSGTTGRRDLLLDPSNAEWQKPAPAVSRLRFETTKGAFVLELHRAWGPLGADRVYNLARLGYYDDTRLHRVRADIAHFGIHGDPRVNAAWSKAELRDDPPRSTNRRGTFALAFPARPNSRTTQIYINKTDNARSDPEAFTVLGTVVEGMDVVDRLYAGYGEESGGGMRQGKQGPLLEGGNAFMDRTYPALDRIIRVTVR